MTPTLPYLIMERIARWAYANARQLGMSSDEAVREAMDCAQFAKEMWGWRKPLCSRSIASPERREDA
jgi:hypothetical protein